MAGKADGKSGNSGVLRVKYRKGIKERASSTGWSCFRAGFNEDGPNTAEVLSDLDKSSLSALVWPED